MNLLHMKYAIAVANNNSINKAADELYVGAPALSRAIKDLEANLGTSLFERSAKGMFLTADGELFIQYAKKILKEVDGIESLFKNGTDKKEQFSVTVPRASYITKAFVDFTLKIDKNIKCDLFYNESDSFGVINNVVKDDFKLGILRCNEQQESFYKIMMAEKGITGELITEFSYVLLVSKDSRLNSKKLITYNDTEMYTEIIHSDTGISASNGSKVKNEELPSHGGNKIFVSEGGSRFEILSKNPDTFMWVSAVPDDLLKRYNLVLRRCNETNQNYKDILIHRNDYSLSSLDNIFIEELIKTKREVFDKMIDNSNKNAR